MTPKPRQILALAALLTASLLLTGCGAVIVQKPPPEQTAVQVLLIDHGRHSSLVLPTSDQQSLRFSYGDWAFYAEGLTGPGHALKALIIPSRAALGRQQLTAAAEPSEIRRVLIVGIEDMIPLTVDAQRVQELTDRLNTLYQANQDTLAYRPELDLWFVQHPRRYTLRHNSNRVVADWLRELGLEVRGQPVLSRWQLIELAPE